jgi:hypothetical protein
VGRAVEADRRVRFKFSRREPVLVAGTVGAARPAFNPTMVL